MTHTRVKPNIENVFFFFEFRLAALGALGSLGKKGFHRLVEPDIDAFFLDQIRDVIERRRIGLGLVAVLAVKDRDRNAPVSLTRKYTSPDATRSCLRFG